MANCLFFKPGLIVVVAVAAFVAVVAAAGAVVAAVVVGQNMASFFLRHLSARVRLIEGRLLLMKAHESSWKRRNYQRQTYGEND